MRIKSVMLVLGMGMGVGVGMLIGGLSFAEEVNPYCGDSSDRMCREILLPVVDIERALQGESVTTWDGGKDGSASVTSTHEDIVRGAAAIEVSKGLAQKWHFEKNTSRAWIRFEYGLTIQTRFHARCGTDTGCFNSTYQYCVWEKGVESSAVCAKLHYSYYWH